MASKRDSSGVGMQPRLGTTDQAHLSRPQASVSAVHVHSQVVQMRLNTGAPATHVAVIEPRRGRRHQWTRSAQRHRPRVYAHPVAVFGTAGAADRAVLRTCGEPSAMSVRCAPRPSSPGRPPGRRRRDGRRLAHSRARRGVTVQVVSSARDGGQQIRAIIQSLACGHDRMRPGNRVRYGHDTVLLVERPGDRPAAATA